MTDELMKGAATDDAPPAVVMAEVLVCAESWVPEARIIGNVRAGDIARSIRALSATPAQTKGDDLVKRLQSRKGEALTRTEKLLDEAATRIQSLTASNEALIEETVERIASALDDEADITPCAEDAMVVKSCADLVRADFSYDEVERRENELQAAQAEIARMREALDKAHSLAVTMRDSRMTKSVIAPAEFHEMVEATRPVATTPPINGSLTPQEPT